MRDAIRDQHLTDADAVSSPVSARMSCVRRWSSHAVQERVLFGVRVVVLDALPDSGDAAPDNRLLFEVRQSRSEFSEAACAARRAVAVSWGRLEIIGVFRPPWSH
eukprot:CAMPEP_0185846438 /NCGR_PEP_ID=MMETSP1354-20130828/2073_1 /TAXON_ID=708628 /ORGANISM="Erythrolobus madagascarensis, Strain CCMP3276" /LENGTH=104 /DNA_ID=CAMNT_0028546569 /DNA_START=716 /DNA_END=1031 /DNA_ORIENTATION=+